jgi:H+/Cl- antiporter ClcA
MVVTGNLRSPGPVWQGWRVTNERGARQLVTTSVVAALLAALGALATVLFIRVLHAVIELVWTTIPDRLGVSGQGWTYILPVCALGGVLVGIARHFLGEWPRSLEESLEDFKRDRAFDYTHLLQAVVIALLSLGFGAALGPEAALTALIGGLCSWMALLIKANAAGRDTLTYLGIVGSLGALFGTAGAAALPLDDPGRREIKRLWVIVPGVIAAGVGAFVFSKLSGTGGYFHFNYPPYSFNAIDLLYALVPMVGGVVIAILLVVVGQAVADAFRRVPNKVVQSLLGGIGLGLLGTLTSYALFSGHEGIQELINETDLSAGRFAGLALVKVAAVAVCIGSGWKGGRFFPIMFAGAAIGLAMGPLVASMPPVVGLCAGMTAAVAGLLRKPLAAVILMLFLFPVALYPVVVVTGMVAGVIGQRLEARFPALAGTGTPEGDTSAASPPA